MTRPELDAYVRARQVSEDQADKVLLSAQRRIEGEVDLRAGRKAVPPLEERFSVVHHIARREYQFRDQPGQTAFVERWLSMQSAHEAPVVVKAMLDRADERGWTHVRVNGSVEFQRQAWIAATARGIKAVGYESTDGDRTAAVEERARLDKERGQTQAQTGGTITREATREQTVPAWANPLVSPEVDRAAIDPHQPASTRSADTPPAASMPAPAAPPSSRRAAGEPAIAEPLRRFLLARGESGQDVEAMVTLASATMKHERVYVGQVVALEHRGMQTVTVSVKDRDPAGKVIGAHEEVGRRNTWFAVGIEQLRADSARSSTPLEQTASSDSKGAQRSQPTQGTAQETATPSTTASMAQATARSAAPATKDSDAMVAAAFEAAIAAKNVPLNLRDALRENFRKELAERHARGETARVKVYDPSASRLPTRTVAPPPQRQREEQERAR